MKKKISILLVLIMIVTMAAACGSGGGGNSEKEEKSGKTENTGDKIKVKFWGHVNEAWNSSYEQLIEEFNASQDEIEVEATFFPYSDFEAKIQTSLLSGGEGADVYEIWGGWALDFIDADTLSPVPSELMDELLEDCYEPVIGAFKGKEDDGTYYGVPREYNIEYGGMIVNKPRFEEEGLAYPKTWDEMIDIAKSVSKSDGDVMEMRGFEFPGSDTLAIDYLSMILSQGGQYLKDGKISLNTPESINAMTALVDYVKNDKITNLDSLTNALGDGLEGQYFIGVDEAMMVPRGPWTVADLEASYGMKYGEDFDYVAQPFYGETKAFPAETGWGMCVPKSSKAADAAWEFVKFVSEPERLMEHNVRCGQVPPRKSVAEDPKLIEQMPYLKELIPCLDYGHFIGDFNTEVLKKDIIQVFISLCNDDGTYTSVEDAVVKLEQQLNKDLKLE